MIEPRPEVALRLAELKKNGAFPVLAIKTIREEFGLSLREAKLQFSRSPEWTAEQAAAEVLHDEIVEALRIMDAD